MRPTRPARWLVAFDLDGTLVGGAVAPELQQALEARSPDTALAYVTGRTYPSAAELVKTEGLPWPDAWATGLGAEVRWGPSAWVDRAWRRRVGRHFSAGRVKRLLARSPGLALQPPEALHRFKVSCWVSPDAPEPLVASLSERLRHSQIRARLVLSSRRDLDVIPVAAGKGLALRWIASQLGVPAAATFACGDSCNDLDMLLAAGMAAVVSNAEPALSAQLPPEVYRASAPCASGALEGLTHWLGPRFGLATPGPDAEG
ncbi:MAG: HAD family hydrolase [Candidatus Sericytochromatia bacterium]|nr:HAD family hydrolase [Candidatus Sericytochromatia bacterium]